MGKRYEETFHQLEHADYKHTCEKMFNITSNKGNEI